MNAIIAKAQNLSKEFDKKMVLNHITLDVMEGEIFGILGANGAGKTTFLKLMAVYLNPPKGNAQYFKKTRGVSAIRF